MHGKGWAGESEKGEEEKKGKGEGQNGGEVLASGAEKGGERERMERWGWGCGGGRGERKEWGALGVRREGGEGEGGDKVYNIVQNMK